MPQTLRAGGEIDAFCTRCRMLLAHTILALVGQRPARVQCNTCGGQHNYRASPDAPKEEAPKAQARASTRTAEPRGSRARLSFEESLAARSGAGKPYSPKATFLADEVVVHPLFGRGYVGAVRQDKIDVVFQAGTKTLIHGRG